MRKKVFLWDIDGTLLLTGGAGISAFNRLFEEFYGEKFIWQKMSPDGKTDDVIIGELYSQRFHKNPSHEELRRIAKRYNELMAEEIIRSKKFRLMPYVLETLEVLNRKEEVSLGLATGNYEVSARNKLIRGGLDHFFSYGGFGSDSSDRFQLTQIALERAMAYLGNAPEGGTPFDLFVVGDTVSDIRCGKKIGATTIAVCTGSTSRPVLEKEGADRVLDDLSLFFSVVSL